jgi:hypothetical protein
VDKFRGALAARGVWLHRYLGRQRLGDKCLGRKRLLILAKVLKYAILLEDES